MSTAIKFNYYVPLSAYLLGLCSGILVAIPVIFASDIDLGMMKSAMNKEAKPEPQVQQAPASPPSPQEIIRLAPTSAQINPATAPEITAPFFAAPPRQTAPPAPQVSKEEAVKVDLSKRRNSLGQSQVDAPFSLNKDSTATTH